LAADRRLMFGMRRRIAIIILLFTSGLATAAQDSSSSTATSERVAANQSRGFSYPYYLYIPPELRTADAKRQTHTLLVLPNNTGKISDDFAVHEADVRKRMAQVPAIASLLKVAVLMPVFPRPETDWKIYTQALDRDSMVTEKKEYRRFDLQLVAMIDDARGRLAGQKLKFDRRVLINGFSAQGMFANRFTFLHPDRVKAAVIGSPGGWPIAPVARYKDKDLRYPIGVADFRQVSGKRMNLRKLRRVPLFIFVGDQDDNDSVVFGDSYDDEDRDLILPLFGQKPVDRWETIRSLYQQAGLDAEFRLYPGVAHTVTPAMRDDIRAFLVKHK
jgi:predicted esterase